MARITFDEINGLPDVLDASAFKLLLGAIPGSGNTEHLTLKCQTVNIPGFSNQAYDVTLHGHNVSFRGNKAYTKTLSATFVETAGSETMIALAGWHERISGSNSNNSQEYKRGYSVLATLLSYDTTGRISNETRIQNLFLNDFPDISLNGETSAAVLINATFKFDRIISSRVPVL
jgi:hypothetical protein